MPTTRAWRDLDEANALTQTLSISHLRFTGLSRGQFIHLPAPGEFAGFLQGATRAGVENESTSLEKEWLAEDRNSADRLESALVRGPNSEPAYVRALSHLVPAGARVYVGNSLPIRWWDLAATRDRVVAVEANRGVNGIDGQLSTGLGLTAGLSGAAARDVWVLLGDLTALYDLAAPWALRTAALQEFSKSGHKLRIFVLNNSGGRIFTRVLAKAPGGAAPFENQHDIHFEKWAEMWNLQYVRVASAGELKSAAENESPVSIVEIIPSSQETAVFWAGL